MQTLGQVWFYYLNRDYMCIKSFLNGFNFRIIDLINTKHCPFVKYYVVIRDYFIIHIPSPFPTWKSLRVSLLYSFFYLILMLWWGRQNVVISLWPFIEESDEPNVYEGDMILTAEQRVAALNGQRGSIRNRRWPKRNIVLRNWQFAW